MKEQIKEEECSNLRSDNIINTDSDRLKLSKELKANEIIASKLNGIEEIIDINKIKEKDGLEGKENPEEKKSEDEEDENYEIIFSN